MSCLFFLANIPIERYQNVVDKYFVPNSQIIHDGLAVKFLGSDVVDHLNYVLQCSYISVCKLLNLRI